MASYNAFAPFYDRFIRPVDYRARAAYFHMLFAQQQIGGQALLLDLACGTGSLSVELARLGYEVIGADASAQMLSIAQQKAYEAEQQILFLHQRMETLDLYGTVRGCVCALDSLNHLADERALRRAIGRVALFLEPGGVFIFDMNTPYKHRQVLADHCFVYEQGDTMCVWQNRTEGLRTEILLDFFTHEADGRYQRAAEHFFERAYEPDVVRAVLTDCGLTPLALYAADTTAPPGPDCERYIFVAKKGD